MSRPAIVVVAGVTAAGKTAAAIELARARSGELVGADSVQVVRGFDIGSAKPTQSELAGVRHHLIDVVDPDEAIDAMRFAELADAAIDEIASRGRLPIVVGGTGLWLRALLRGLLELPPVDEALRARLEAEAEAIGPQALHRRVAEVDPASAAWMHPNDQRRLVRALEVHAQTGEALGALQAAHQRGGLRYEAEVYVLDRPRDALYAALRTRITQMLAAGWAAEVRALLERWGPDVRAMGSVGYAQVAAHVRGELDAEALEQEVYRATRTYTRRQRTWLRGGARDGTWSDAVWTTSQALRSSTE